MTGTLERPATPAELIDDLDPDGTIRARRGTAAAAQPAAAVASPDRADPDGLPPLADRVRRATRYLAKLPPGVEGEHGSNPTYNAARVLVWGFCLDEQTAYNLLAAEYNPRCLPPWSERELRHKIADAATKPCRRERGWVFRRDAERRRADPVATLPGPTPAAGQPGREVPTIVQQPAQLRDVVRAGVEALALANDPPALFVYGDSLARIDPAADARHVLPLSKAQLRLTLSKAADWVNESVTREGEVSQKPAYPRQEVVESVQDHRDWPGLPRLTSVADVPVITKASGLLTRPGFDAASGVYLLPGGYSSVEPVSERPDCHEVEAARDLILEELLGDFPFADDASRANALALFLLPFVRDLVDGPTPLHHVDAPQEGTGKSLFAETWGVVSLGREPEALAEVTRADDWQKLILAALIEAPRAVYLDNLNHTLDSGALASSLTAPAVSGRLLGFSRMVSAPVRCVWVSTANNLRMSRELVRRTVYIRLDAGRDAAWQGRMFRHQLPRWAVLNRGKLVWACLTLCQAWVAAGMPPGRALLGKFEAWSMVIDGILSHAGITDLLGNADTFRAAAVDSQDEWRTFVVAWWDRHRSAAVEVADLLKLATYGNLLDEVLGDQGERSQRTRLGKALGRVRDRVFDGIKVEGGKRNSEGRTVYRLRNTNSPVPAPDDQEREHAIPL